MIKYIRSIFNRILGYKRTIVSEPTVQGDIVFEGNNMIDYGAKVSSAYLGKGSYVSFDCRISKVKIGRYTSIGPRVYIGFGNHPSHTWITTYPGFYVNMKELLPWGFHDDSKPLFNSWKEAVPGFLVEIGSDVWIGADVKIMDGCRIGNGAIVAAGAVVTRDVPPYSIVAGVPAKILKYRFSPEDREYLDKAQWWNMPENWLSENYKAFSNIEDFQNIMNKYCKLTE